MAKYVFAEEEEEECSDEDSDEDEDWDDDYDSGTEEGAVPLCDGVCPPGGYCESPAGCMEVF